MTNRRGFGIWNLKFEIRTKWLVCALLALSSVVFAADWASDERMVLSVKIPEKSWTLKDLCAEFGKQTSSEFYVDRRDGDMTVAWYAGDLKLKPAMTAIEITTGRKWRMVGDMFYLSRDPQGAAVTRWNARYAEAKKIQLAGLERKLVKDWVYTSMPFPARYDVPWALTPLQREQVAYNRALLFYTMTPFQLNWLNSALVGLGYDQSYGLPAVEQAAYASPSTPVVVDNRMVINEGYPAMVQVIRALAYAPVTFNAAMIIRDQNGSYLIEMPLSSPVEEPAETEPKPETAIIAAAPTSADATVEADAAPADADITAVKKISLKTTVKGLWLTDLDISSFGALVSKAKAKGFDTIFLPVLRNGRTIYPSKVFPDDSGAQDSDALRSALKIADDAGMKVHAVLETTLWGDAANPPPASTRYPALYARNLLGRTFAEQSKWQQSEMKTLKPDETTTADTRIFLCPASSRLPGLLASLAEEIAVNYDVAGICLDDVDYPKPEPFMLGGEDLSPGYGYNAEVRRDMIRLNQIDPIDVDPQSVRSDQDSSAFALWDIFRRGHLTGLLNEVSAAYKKKNADGIFSATVNLGSADQSPATWSRLTGLDAIIPLVEIRAPKTGTDYTLEKADSDAVRDLHRAVIRHAAVVPAVIGLPSQSVSDAMPAVADALKMVHDGGLRGYILRGDPATLSIVLDLVQE